MQYPIKQLLLFIRLHRKRIQIASGDHTLTITTLSYKRIRQTAINFPPSSPKHKALDHKISCKVWQLLRPDSEVTQRLVRGYSEMPWSKQLKDLYHKGSAHESSHNKPLQFIAAAFYYIHPQIDSLILIKHPNRHFHTTAQYSCNCSISFKCNWKWEL